MRVGRSGGEIVRSGRQRFLTERMLLVIGGIEVLDRARCILTCFTRVRFQKYW